MRRTILLFLIGTSVLSSPAIGPREILSLETHWERFISDYFGCKWKEKGRFDAETCIPRIGSINYVEFRKAREAAKKLFDLKD